MVSVLALLSSSRAGLLKYEISSSTQHLAVTLGPSKVALGWCSLQVTSPRMAFPASPWTALSQVSRHSACQPFLEWTDAYSWHKENQFLMPRLPLWVSFFSWFDRSGDGGKWLHSGYILKVKVTDLLMQWMLEQGIKNDFIVWGLSHGNEIGIWERERGQVMWGRKRKGGVMWTQVEKNHWRWLRREVRTCRVNWLKVLVITKNC